MRRVGFLLGALLLVALWVLPAVAQGGGGSFADVPLEHWAYDAVNRLAEAGLIEGYPPNYDFRGARAMTRYEMAMVISRMLDYIAKNYCAKADCGGKAPDMSQYVTKQELQDAISKIQTSPGVSEAQLKAVQSDVDRLRREFSDEIAKIRKDLTDLEGRVSALEEKLENVPMMPKITLSGDLRWRTGLYGNKLKFAGSKETTGYFDAAGSSDSTNKDAFKAGKFSTMRMRLVAAGMVNDKVSVMAEMFSDERDNNIFGPGAFAEEETSPQSLFPSGTMSNIRFNEAYAKIQTSVWVPVTLTIGQQYWGWGRGLLVNNNLDPAVIKSAVVTFGKEDGWQISAIAGMVDREAFFAEDNNPVNPFPPVGETFGQDGYDAYRLAIPLGKNWKIGGNWLASGILGENAWSIDVAGKLFRHDVWAEYAKLRKSVDGFKPDSNDKAWIVGANLVQSRSLILGAQYGRVEENYDSILSLLHPYAAFAADYIDWVDRPLFLSEENVAKGWEVTADLPRLLGEKNGLKVRYYAGKAFGPTEGSWVDADAVWTVSWTRELAPDADFTLLYGQRQVKKVLQPDSALEQGALKTLRAEFLVRF